MKKSSVVYQQFKDIVTETFTEMIGEIIVRVDNQYVMYNRYSVTREGGGVMVYRRQDAERYGFSTMKHAVIWITLDRYQFFFERDCVYRLDKSLSSVEVEKQIHAKLRKKYSKDVDVFPIYVTKYQCDVTREKRIVTELDKYYKLANRCHLQGIKNETNRTSKK
jgi:hypothetical protein